ncbi:MAG: helix-turn-helix transcriptional regulator [Pseudomonadota bacterium]
MNKKLWSEREKAYRSELKTIRQMAGLSQEELAARLKKPQIFVSKYENGERQLKFLELETICIQCDTTLAAFCRSFSEKYPL